MATEPTFDDRLVDALAELAAAFERHGIHYALTGGFATGFYARPSLRNAIEVLLAVPQVTLPGLLTDLSARGFTLDRAAVIIEFVHHHLTSFEYHEVRVDWLKPVLPIYQHVLDRARTDDRLGRPMRVVSPEGLILTKLITSHSQDIVDIESLLATNQGRLDLAWVEQEWLTIFPANDPRWVRFRQLIAEHYDRPGPA